jgi:endonuclease/exonuclease/phosphatase family metal-dependent hydrolase
MGIQAIPSSFGWLLTMLPVVNGPRLNELLEELKALKPDIVLLSEVPKANRGKKAKDWSRRMADALNLDYVHVGTVSSAGHKSPKWGDPTGNYGGKFKSILSRTPLTGGKDISVEGSGWKRASAVRVETEIEGRKLALYSLHLPGFAHHNKAPYLIRCLGRDPSIKPSRII